LIVSAPPVNDARCEDREMRRNVSRVARYADAADVVPWVGRRAVPPRLIAVFFAITASMPKEVPTALKK
jgi:hypothetical protein